METFSSPQCDDLPPQKPPEEQKQEQTLAPSTNDHQQIKQPFKYEVDWLALDADFSSGSGGKEFGGSSFDEREPLSSDENDFDKNSPHGQMIQESAFVDAKQETTQQSKKLVQMNNKPPKPIQKPKLSLPAPRQDPDPVLTDPDSIYRKLYNKSLQFFLWTIDVEPAPSIFKLHIQALTLKELTMASVRISIDAIIKGLKPGLDNPYSSQSSNKSSQKSQDAKLNIQFFAKKKQFKVFVTIVDSQLSKSFFETIWAMKELPILDPSDYTKVCFNREMRAYLVRSEARYQQLALRKYQEELQRKSQGSQEKTNPSTGRGRGRGSSRGKQRGGMTSAGAELSYQGSSQETKMGGSAESQLYHKTPSDEISKPQVLKASTSQPNLLDQLKEDEEQKMDKKRRRRRKNRGNTKSNNQNTVEDDDDKVDVPEENIQDDSKASLTQLQETFLTEQIKEPIEETKEEEFVKIIKRKQHFTVQKPVVQQTLTEADILEQALSGSTSKNREKHKLANLEPQDSEDQDQPKLSKGDTVSGLLVKKISRKAKKESKYQ